MLRRKITLNLINLFQTNNGVGDFPVKEYEKILLNIKSLTIEIIKQENEDNLRTKILYYENQIFKH